MFKKFSISLLGAALLAVTPLSFAETIQNNATTVNVSPEERTKIEQVIHEYLLKKPEVLIEAMQVLQKKQYAEAEQTVKQTQQSVGKYANALFHGTADPVAGNPNGTITVVEFFDYQCPHCVEMAPVIGEIIKSNPDVRVVFKEFPIRGPASELAAKAALAANKQGKYYQFSHALLAANAPITKELIYKVAQETGLNVEQLKKDIENTDIGTQLKENVKLAQALKLFGTPAFFIGKTNATGSDNINYIPGRINQTQMQDAIDKAKS